MSTERKRISKGGSVDEQIRHVELGPTVGADVAESVLGLHVTAAFGTRRAGYHHRDFATVSKATFARRTSPCRFLRSSDNSHHDDWTDDGGAPRVRNGDVHGEARDRHPPRLIDETTQIRWARAESNHANVTRSARSFSPSNRPRSRIRCSLSLAETEWARAESNHRSRPCKGRVITN